MDSQEAQGRTPIERYNHLKLRVFQIYQTQLDKSVPQFFPRWGAFLFLLLAFMTRIVLAQGWYIICYGLGIYLLNLFLAFLTPKFDPSLEQALADEEVESGGDLGGLPTRGDQEFRPFIRRLPEFKFWLSASRATLVGFIMSWIPIFDIPVFWYVSLASFRFHLSPY